MLLRAELSAWATLALPRLWLRGPAHLDGESIVLDRERAEEYRPIDEPDLVFDLAMIETPADALEFIGRYGLLWHGPGSAESREGFAEWKREAERIRATLATYERVEAAAHRDDQEAWARLNALYLRMATANGPHPPDLEAPFRVPPKTNGEMLERICWIIETYINRGLVGTELRVIAASDVTGQSDAGFFFLAALPTTLVGAAYHALALLVATHKTIAACPECTRFFVIEDKRQQYCSKQCAGRVRYRRWAEKHRPSASSHRTAEP